jgi:hypothetical protein
MALSLALLVIGVVGAAVVLKRALASPRNISAGQVSESWLREQRAQKQDRFQA